MFLYDAALLMDTLERQGDLGDRGEEPLPALLARGDACAHPMEGYRRDVGTLEACMQTHQGFLNGQGFALDTPDWPVITSSIARPPTRIHGSACLDRAFVCGGAEIAGEVLGGVVGPNAVVAQGASVEAGAQVGGQGEGGPLGVIGAHSVVEGRAGVGPGRIAEPGRPAQQDSTAGKESAGSAPPSLPHLPRRLAGR